MILPDNIEKLFIQTNIETNTDMDKVVLGDAVNAMSNSKQKTPSVRRIIMNSKSIKFAAAAVVFIAVIMGVQIFSLDSATQVFAKAIDSVKQAKTLSCIERFGDKKITEQQWIFKAPDLMRHTSLAGVDGNFLGKATIINYSLRKQLIVNPNNKTAKLIDMSSGYEVNSNTGQVELSQLDTSLRDQLLSLTAKAVKDLGTEKLNGKEVRKLQSKDDRRTTTVWVDPKSGLPIQIELQYKKRMVKYSEIKIDEVVDDGLFSLTAPSGYKLGRSPRPWPDEKCKVAARVMFLLIKCWEFAGKNHDQFPKTLSELESTGLSKQALQNILSDKSSKIKYAKPDLQADRSTQIAMYEEFDQWPEDGVVVGFADAHAELVATEQAFNDLIAKKSTEGGN